MMQMNPNERTCFWQGFLQLQSRERRDEENGETVGSVGQIPLAFCNIINIDDMEGWRGREGRKVYAEPPPGNCQISNARIR